MRTFATAVGLTLALFPFALPAKAQAPAGSQTPTNRIYARVVDRTDTSLHVVDIRGSGQKTTVNVDGETQYARFETAVPADFTAGYLVGVLGQTAGTRFTALRVVRLVQIEGAPSEVQWKAAEVIARMMLRTGRGGSAQTMEPTILQITSASPLKAKTRAGLDVDLQVSSGPRMTKYKEIPAADIQKGDIIQVVPKDGSTGPTVAARAVVKMAYMRSASVRPGR